MNAMTVQDSVEGAMKVHIQEDKEEEAEKAKRKTSAIIPGLREPEATDDDDRIAEDAAQIAEMMDKISCADASIKKIIRLGKRSEEPDATPRPIKLVMETEANSRKCKKLEEHQGRRFCQDIYSSGSYSQGKGSKEETCRRAEAKASQWRERSYTCQREDSGE